MKIIAGPCQHESYAQSLEIAQHCKAVCDDYGIEYIFKASFVMHAIALESIWIK